MKAKLTYALVSAAARDAADRSMRAAGRTRWSRDDWNACCAEWDRLDPDGLTMLAPASDTRPAARLKAERR